MKVIATCRSYNEIANIDAFCQSYSEFADEILIADGLSTDDTVAHALKYPKVKVKDYPWKVECANGVLRNPDGPHIQFLIDWAVAEGADWIVHQDCDQRPNKYLKQDIRDILATTNKDLICVMQAFLWGPDKYFPQLSGKDSGWMYGLWAWRANIGMKIIDKMPHYEFSLDGKKSFDVRSIHRHVDLNPPYCFMHFGWPTPERAMKQVDYYRASRLIPECNYPLNYGGRLEPLEVWMEE